MIEEYLLHNYPLTASGWAALATGVAAVAALILAILAFAFGRLYGQVGDALVALTAVLSAGLSMLLFPEHRLIEQQLAEIAFGLALLGAFIAAFGAVLALTEAASWFLAQLYVALGYSLLGLWLLILNLSARDAFIFPHRAVNMGLFAGAVMSLGLGAIPGVLGRSSVEESASWISRVIGRAGYLGWQVLFPLWCIWLAVSRLPF